MTDPSLKCRKRKHLLYIEADEKVEGNIRLEAVSVDAEQLEHLDIENVSFYVNRTLVKKVFISIQGSGERTCLSFSDWMRTKR